MLRKSGVRDLPHRRRQDDAEGGGREAGGEARVRAQEEALAVLLDLGLGERVEVSAITAAQEARTRLAAAARRSSSSFFSTSAPRAGSRRSADRRGHPRFSCGNTWREARRRTRCGTHKIRRDSQKIKQNSHKTWHYIFAPASHPIKLYQRLMRHAHALTVEDQSD